MKIWSKGLGKIELILDFEKLHVEREETENGENIYIKGMITDPVMWDFRITMTKEDIPGLMNIALDKEILFMFLKNPKQAALSSLKHLLKQVNIGNGAASDEMIGGEDAKDPESGQDS